MLFCPPKGSVSQHALEQGCACQHASGQGVCEQEGCGQGGCVDRVVGVDGEGVVRGEGVHSPHPP